MISFRTEVSLPKVSKKISYRQHTLMVGSCFTENIGTYLHSHYLPIQVNPCGIVYNPASIAECLGFLMGAKQFNESDLFFANGLWNNFYFHSRFSNPDKETTLSKINDSITLATSKLRLTSHLFLTFGTSWVYREKQNGRIVANCHKLPENMFVRERLTVDAMTLQWIELLNRTFAINPQLNIIFTISPIRHFKDGSYENQVSKSGLFLVVDNLISHFGSERITYFPSYELVMDELRDYRFYASDMLHLSETANAFIQEKFNSIFLDNESKEVIQRIEKIVKSIMHKPFQTESTAYRNLLSKLNEDALKIAKDYPSISFEGLINDIIQKKKS